jgi:hypothetical protein
MPKKVREAVRPEREPVRDQVSRRLATLKGQSRADLERDDRRGAISPLGHGKRKGR